jgi:hypothetical protein
VAEAVTILLKQLGKGDRSVLDNPLVYQELHQIAEAYLRREGWAYVAPHLPDP